MSNARLRLAFVEETMFEHGGTRGSPMYPLLRKNVQPPRAPFFFESVGKPPGSPTPLPHPHRPEAGR